MVVLIDEKLLDAFRRDHLAPEPLFQLIERAVAALVRVAVGVGKSWAVDALLMYARLYERFDLVIYVAPTWAILNERRIISGLDSPPVPHLVIRPRPRKRCGPLDDHWQRLETRGCAAYAKATLCAACPHLDVSDDPCTWPAQLRHIDGIGLVLAPEEQFKLNRSLLLLLLGQTKAKRPLVILDEGQLFDTRFEVKIAHDDVDRFAAAVNVADKISAIDAEKTRIFVEHVKRGALQTLPDFADLAFSLSSRALEIQRAGIARFGTDFRFVGYDLRMLCWARDAERWHELGAVRFIARPYLRCHVLVLSAHLTSHYVGLRLGESAIESPYEGHRFLHSGTRVFNIRSRSGADSYFEKNHRSILDTFAVAVARNIDLGRTTVLVCRKKQKDFCTDYLKPRLADWGYAVTFITDGTDALPATPDPRTIPAIHYGVLGVNDYERYDSLYCLSSYYVSDSTLRTTALEFDPDLLTVDLEIVADQEKRRRVRVANARMSAAAVERVANEYLRRLELDRVIQVAGRVRFATRPRDIVFFQMADLAAEIPGCVDVATPTALRQALGLPDPRELDVGGMARRGRELMASGMSAGEAAGHLGIGRRTLFRHFESAKTPIRVSSIRRIGTPPSADGGAP